MLFLYVSTEQLATVRRFIESEERLNEVVTLQTIGENNNAENISLIIENQVIRIGLDWYNQLPPYLFSNKITFKKETLLGMVFGLLGNYEKTWEYLSSEPQLLKDWDIFVRLLQGYAIDWQDFTSENTESHEYENYRANHNAAIIRHYVYTEDPDSIDSIENYYQKAIESIDNIDYKAFTVKHFATFFLDAEKLDKAEILLERILLEKLQEDAKFALKSLLVSILIKKLVVPYDKLLVENLKNQLWETFQFYEQKGKKTETGMLLIDASFVANIENSFSESLGYISKAIKYLEEENLTEMVGNALLRKGTLLYTWSKNGNPQFYRPALEAFQEALRIFDRENAPDVFADIHHSLAVLYAEMPDEDKKRSVWAALSSTSFKESLNFYTKENYPYEYAMICNNYANAMTNYPQMKKADNYQKAIELYNEALTIRIAKHFPYERALTLINYLEASWLVGNEEEYFNQERYEEMLTKALEIKNLVADEKLIAEADRHLKDLEKLKQEL
jgi:tetratricopeptide (TPR) repeat protein